MKSLTDSPNLTVSGGLLSYLTWEILQSDIARLLRWPVFEIYRSENKITSEDHVKSTSTLVFTIHFDSQRYVFGFTITNQRRVSFIRLHVVRQQHESGNDKLLAINMNCFQRCRPPTNRSCEFVGATSVFPISVTHYESSRKIAVSYITFNPIVLLLLITGQIFLCFLIIFLFAKNFIKAFCSLSVHFRCDDVNSSQLFAGSLVFPLLRAMTRRKRNRMWLARYLKITVISVLAICASAQSLVIPSLSIVDSPLHSSRALTGTTGI